MMILVSSLNPKIIIISFTRLDTLFCAYCIEMLVVTFDTLSKCRYVDPSAILDKHKRKKPAYVVQEVTTEEENL